MFPIKEQRVCRSFQYLDFVSLCQHLQTNIHMKDFLEKLIRIEWRGAEKGIFEIDDISLTNYLVPQECGMRMGTEWLEVTRHTSLNNCRKGNSNQILRIEKKDKGFAFSCLPYTASEIENATHHEELPPARRTVLLYLWSGKRCRRN